LIVCGITVFHAQIEILNVDIKVRKNQLFFDEFPDDASHFVAVEFNDGICNFDFFHELVLCEFGYKA
jgi:hypothetical protein